MGPWHVLGLEATGDTRAIKRAYARLLKSTRPDEHPRQFQALHAAYKRALSLAEQHARAADAGPETATGEQAERKPVATAAETLPPSPERPEWPASVVPDDPLVAPEESEPAFLDQPPPPARDPEPAWTAARELEEREPEEDERLAASREHERLLIQCQALLDREGQPAAETEWRFLASNPWMLDSAFHHGLGDALMARLVERSRQQEGTPPLDAATLGYLNSLFDWEGRRGLLAARFGDAAMERVLAPLDASSSGDQALLRGLRGGKETVPPARQANAEPKPETLYFTGMTLRMVALVIDLLVLAALLVMPIWVVSIMVADFNGTGGDIRIESFMSFFLVLAVPAYLLMALVMEAGPRQATPGKRMLGLRVTNREFQRLPFLHNLWRVIAFVVVNALTSKVVILVNLFLKGYLLHDRVSRSYVINWARSQREEKDAK
ncbi:RDD family protein [Alcanivorax sp. 24]|uniref:RDD family protein n=1 Tax=Alcanivorax sp. 24 TaxID=2545266 RepID=UPI00105BEC57|nr:RDD family protein [Alcanivorax sp. 24]